MNISFTKIALQKSKHIKKYLEVSLSKNRVLSSPGPLWITLFLFFFYHLWNNTSGILKNHLLEGKDEKPPD